MEVLSLKGDSAISLGQVFQRRSLESLAIDSAGSYRVSYNMAAVAGAREVSGRKRTVKILKVNPTPSTVEGDLLPEKNGLDFHSDNWTEGKNARRCELIDGKIAGTLKDGEAIELANLQEEMLRHRRAVAPLPLDDLRLLHQKLIWLSMGDSK